jgi:hypothetical protein
VASANRDAISGAPQRILDEILYKSKEVAVVASDHIEGRNPELATDEFVNTSWASALKKGADANFLEATFQGSPRLVYVFITAPSSEPAPREQRLRVLISVHHKGAKDGLYQNFPVVDVPIDKQRHGYYVGTDSVEKVRLTIVEPTSATAKRVSIAGVQFTGR